MKPPLNIFRFLFCLSMLLTFIASGVTAQEVVIKAPPPNDNFANAQMLSVSEHVVINDIDEATIEPGEKAHICRVGGATPGVNSVWFKFVVPGNGSISVDTTASWYGDDDDNVLSIYNETLTETVHCEEEGPGGDDLVAFTDFPINPGTYYMQVSAVDEDSIDGSSYLDLDFDFNADPTPTYTMPATLDPSITPSATNTADPNITPSSTPEPFTETPIPSATPTPLIPFAELLSNRSFEFDNNNNGDPDDWISSGSSGDKWKCNKDKDGDGLADKIVAFDGNCAYVYKSGIGENSKLTQDVDLTIALPAQANAGDTLVLSGYVHAKGVVKAKVKVRVTYTDSLLPKGKINAKVDAPSDDYVALVTASNLVLAGQPQLIRVQLQNKGTSGKVLFDLMSLQLNNTVAP
jgi:hypothetical protein